MDAAFHAVETSAPTQPTDRLRRRLDIDALRAVAVTLVVLFHAFPGRVPGGFVGVDVFFVISGYVITRDIVDRLRARCWSIVGFYGRRARRIIPALCVVLLFVWVVGRFELTTDEFRSLGEYMLAAATFSSNIALWQDAGYFDIGSEWKPLLHLWSLGVEEQFYLLWPLLIGVTALRRGYALVVFSALGFASLTICVLWAGHHTDAGFYLLPGRFWELMAGGALAYAHAMPGSGTWARCEMRGPLAASLSVAGIALILLAASGAAGVYPYPGWRAIVPVAGTVLLIAAGPAALMNRALSRWGLVRTLGLISYPLYLWHWPLFVFARLVSAAEPSAVVRAAIAALATVLAWLTWKCVEQPYQQKAFASRSHRKAALSHIGLALSALFIVGAVGVMTSDDKLLSKTQRATIAVANYRRLKDWQHGNSACLLPVEVGAGGYAASCFGGTARPAVVLWGDSFANHLYAGIAKWAGHASSVVTLTASSCPPVLDFVRDTRADCAELNAWDMQTIRRLQPAAVVLQALWFYDYRSPGFIEKLKTTIAELRRAGVARILVAGQLPVWLPSLPEIVERRYLSRGLPVPAFVSAGIDPALFRVDAELSEQLAGTGAIYVPLMGQMCEPSRGCPPMLGPDLATDLESFDAGHLTNHASIYIATNFIAAKL